MTEYIAGRLLTTSYNSVSSVVAVYDTLDYSALPQMPGALSVAGMLYRIVVSPVGGLMALCWSGAPGVTLVDNTGADTGFASGLTSGSHHAAFSPDGSLLAITSFTSPYLFVYDVASGALVWQPSANIPTSARCVAFSPDGSLLVVGHTATERLTAWDVGTWTKNPVLQTTNRPLGSPLAGSIAFSPDGAFLAVGHYTLPCLTVYRTIPSPTMWSKETVATDNAGQATFSGDSVAFSPDSSRLAFGRGPNAAEDLATVFLYDTADWSKQLLSPLKSVSSVAFSSDGGTLAVGGDNSTQKLFLYDTSTLLELPQPSDAPYASINTVVYGVSPPPNTTPFWTNKIKTAEIV